jgi:hypothetical protein
LFGEAAITHLFPSPREQHDDGRLAPPEFRFRACMQF